MNRPIEDYIIRFLAREETPEDVQKLKEWLAANPEHREELKEWLAIWDFAGKTDVANPDDAYRRFMFRLNREATEKANKKELRTEMILRNFRRIAVVFIISFSLGILGHYFWTKMQSEQIAFTEIVVPFGSQSEVKLPDGSTVWGNAGSTLRYPSDYGKKTRDIYLSGEGYFKVARHDGKPFVVHTALSNIRALGTEFNVKAYPDEDVVETTLIKGRVSVEKGEKSSSIDEPILLIPGQKLLVTAYSSIIEQEQESQPAQAAEAEQLAEIRHPQPVIKQLTPAVANAEVSWKERNWRIESEQLQDLAIKMERRYDVSIQVDEQLKNYRFTGTIKDESLEQVLHAMQLSAPILFNVNGKNVTISIDPKKIMNLTFQIDSKK